MRPWAKETPDKVAIVESGEKWTYGQLECAITEAERFLSESGIRPGDRVMIIGENCRSLAVFLLAASGIDAWPVPVSARFSAREVDQIREHCTPRRILYVGASPHAREHARRHGAETNHLGLVGAVAMGMLNETAIPEDIDGRISDRVAALIYTSGTTGLPKGVMLSHRNLLFVAATSAKIRRLTPTDGMYGVLPMFHVTGLSVNLLGPLLSGATLYIAGRFDPRTFCDEVGKNQLTIVVGVPGMFALLASYAATQSIRSLRFPSLRIISSSGAPLDLELKTSIENLFGLTLNNGYGITECSPTIAQTRVEDRRSDTSVGAVLPGVEIKLVASDGHAVVDGEVGELWVRGPNVMKGYYRSPEETAAVIDSEGWFNTRDLARVVEGDLFIVGRAKELIIRFGYNVYPAEIEALLNSHPEIARSAVIGRRLDGQEGNEQIIAFVQPMPGSGITAAEISKFAGRNLSTYKRPSHVLLLPELPLTASGKIAKRELPELEAYKCLPAEQF